MSSSDRECIEQCLNGHPDEYRRLVSRYQAGLLTYLTGRLGDREQAEEAAQESFVRAYFSLKKLDKPELYFSWLLGIAKRVAKEQARVEKQQKNARGIDSARLELEAAVSAGHKSDACLERAVARLPDPCRETVLLRYYGGWSCSEVAKKLNVATGTITKRLSRAYTKLRESLQDIDHERDKSEVQS